MADEEFMENTGFLDDVVAYYPPLKSGFISIPCADSAKYGWEKPFTQPPGSVVSKEDKGDGKTQVLFQWKETKQEWKVKRGLNLEYGNIEFIQKFDTSGNPLKTPLIVSFDGPLNRHMLGDDNYYAKADGTLVCPVPKPLSNKVYMKGVLVALKDDDEKVIGVCIRHSESGTKWLVIAAKYGISAIRFYRYKPGKKDSLEIIGTVIDKMGERESDVASVVHFSDSGTQAVAYVRITDSVNTSFFGSQYPESFEVFCARRVLIQISYDQDTPISVSFIATKTHTISASDVQNSGGECGSENYTRERSVSFSQEIAGEFQGEVLKTARVSTKFAITHGERRSKAFYHQSGSYRVFETWFYLETVGTGHIGDPCFCAGVPSGLILGCGGTISRSAPSLCQMVTLYKVTIERMNQFTTCGITLTVDGVVVDSEDYALYGSNSVSYVSDCSEASTPIPASPGISTIVAVILPEEGVGWPNVCVNTKIVHKQSNYPTGCVWDPMPPPLPPGYVVLVSPETYRPVNVVMLDMKRGNYLIRKCTNKDAENGELRGKMDETTVKVDCKHRGSSLNRRFTNNVGYGYSYFTAIGDETGGVYDSLYPGEYPDYYPDDSLQVRLGYAVDSYGHVFCCASEPYDAATGISIYPVYTYLSGTDPLDLNQSVSNGARFKKIGVI